MDKRRACRIAVYTKVQIFADADDPTLMEWAAKRATYLYRHLNRIFFAAVRFRVGKRLLLKALGSCSRRMSFLCSPDCNPHSKETSRLAERLPCAFLNIAARASKSLPRRSAPVRTGVRYVKGRQAHC